MAQYQTIEFASSNGVARITLNRPDRLNSFTRAMHAELAEALDAAADARVIILTGAGRGFCARQDLNDRSVAVERAARSSFPVATNASISRARAASAAV